MTNNSNERIQTIIAKFNSKKKWNGNYAETEKICQEIADQMKLDVETVLDIVCLNRYEKELPEEQEANEDEEE